MFVVESHQIHFYNEEDAQVRKRSVQFEYLENDDGYYSSIVASLYYVILKCATRSTSLVNFVIALINRSVLLQYTILNCLCQCRSCQSNEQTIVGRDATTEKYKESFDVSSEGPSSGVTSS